MSLLPYLRGHERRWELDYTVTADEVDKADVVVIDIGLRGKVGYDLARRLTNRKPKRPVVIVISNDRDATVEPGLDACLAKPVDPYKFVGLLAKLSAFYGRLQLSSASGQTLP
jgi:DNA-binding NarL/FixJ family response regulator